MICKRERPTKADINILEKVGLKYSDIRFFVNIEKCQQILQPEMGYQKQFFIVLDEIQNLYIKNPNSS
jgi:hypothetical protein